MIDREKILTANEAAADLANATGVSVEEIYAAIDAVMSAGEPVNTFYMAPHTMHEIRCMRARYLHRQRRKQIRRRQARAAFRRRKRGLA